MQAIYSPVVLHTPVSFEVQPPSVEEMARRIRAVMPAHPWLVLTEADDVLGYAYGHGFAERAAYRWSAEMSVYVEEASRGTGVGRALCLSLLALLAAQGYREVLAGITLPNPASVRLHESVGFRPAGRYSRVGWKMGAWRDVGWWQQHLGEGDGPPSPPVDVDQLPPTVLTAALASGVQEAS